MPAARAAILPYFRAPHTIALKVDGSGIAETGRVAHDPTDGFVPAAVEHYCRANGIESIETYRSRRAQGRADDGYGVAWVAPRTRIEGLRIRELARRRPPRWAGTGRARA